MGGQTIRDAEVHLFGHPLTFTFTGIVVAQIIESFPYCMRFSRTAISVVDPASNRPRGHGTLMRIALLVTLPLARRGIVAAS